MATAGWSRGSSLLLALAICLLVLPGKAAAFGAGNIPSVAQVSAILVHEAKAYSRVAAYQPSRLRDTTGVMVVGDDGLVPSSVPY